LLNELKPKVKIRLNSHLINLKMSIEDGEKDKEDREEETD